MREELQMGIVATAIKCFLDGRNADPIPSFLEQLFAAAPDLIGIELHLLRPTIRRYSHPVHFPDEQSIGRIQGSIKRPITINDDEVASLEFSTSSPPTPQLAELAEIASLATSLELKNLIAKHAIEQVTQPIDLDLGDDDYGDQISQMLARATNAQHVIIRISENEGYKAVGYFGISRNFDRTQCTISDQYEPDLFLFLNKFVADASQSSSMSIRRIAANDATGPLLYASRRVFNDNRIQSFIISTLFLAGRVVGTITLLFHQDSREDAIEDDLVFLLANHAAVALQNFRSAGQIKALREERIVSFIQNVNFELVNGLRHAAFNNHHVLRAELKRLKKHIAPPVDPSSKDHPYNVCLDTADLLSDDLSKMEIVVRQHYRHEYGLHDIRELFRAAEERIRRTFTDFHRHPITISVDGPKLECWCIHDAIVYAFINMLLNSQRAIRDLKLSESGRVSFVGRDVGVAVEFDVADNGAGIPIGRGAIRTAEDVFGPGKSSKDDGTGYGLAMVRDVFQRLHSGTISVKQIKPAAFRIQLRRYMASQEQEYKAALRGERTK